MKYGSKFGRGLSSTRRPYPPVPRAPRAAVRGSWFMSALKTFTRSVLSDLRDAPAGPFFIERR